MECLPRDIQFLLFDFLDIQDAIQLARTCQLFLQFYQKHPRMKFESKIQKELFFKRKIIQKFGMKAVDDFPYDFVKAVHCSNFDSYSQIERTEFELTGSRKPLSVLGIDDSIYIPLEIPKYGEIYRASGDYSDIVLFQTRLRKNKIWAFVPEYEVFNECGSCDGTTESRVVMHVGSLKTIWRRIQPDKDGRNSREISIHGM